MGVDDQHYDLAALPQRKEPPVRFGQEAEWAPEPDLDAVEKSFLPLPGIQPWPSSPLLCRLSYPGSK
jgi:hypothetical protein